jgi:hypothetical protein
MRDELLGRPRPCFVYLPEGQPASPSRPIRAVAALLSRRTDTQPAAPAFSDQPRLPNSG